MSSENGFKEFQQEYSSFPRGGRDDILDALWIAVHDLTSSVDAVAISDSSEEELQPRSISDRIKDMDDQETARDRVLSNTGRASLFHRGLI